MLQMTEFSHFRVQKPRRQSPRIPGPFEARLVGDSIVPVTVRDVGTAGCYVESAVSVAMPPIRVHIDLPGEGWIAVQAEVVYRLGRQGVAMKFIDLDEPTRDRILREIERALSQAGG
jgi:PilZ domain